MVKLRIYELARELGLENKALLDLCEKLGIDGKSSHSNTLSDEEADQIRRSVIRRALSDKHSGMVRESTKGGQVITEKRVGDVIRRRRKPLESDRYAGSEGDHRHDDQDDETEFDDQQVDHLETSENSAESVAHSAEQQEDATPFSDLPSAGQHVQAHDDACHANGLDSASESGSVGISILSKDEEVSDLSEDELSVEGDDGVVGSSDLDSIELEVSAIDDGGSEFNEVAVDEEGVISGASDWVGTSKGVVSSKGAGASTGVGPSTGVRVPSKGALKGEDSPEVVARGGRVFVAGELDEIRKRHDIRTPKVLGRIELPVAVVKTKLPLGDGKEKQTVESISRAAAAARAARGDAAKGGESKPASKTGAGAPGSTDSPGTGKHKPAKKDRERKKGEGVEDDDSLVRKPKKKQVLRQADLLDYETDRETWRVRKEKKRKDLDIAGGSAVGPTKASKKVIKIDGEVSVGEMARQMGVKSGDLIKKLMGLGTLANINQLLDFETATVIAADFDFTTINVGAQEEDMVAEAKRVDNPDALKTRPPIVTVMGHVDHGKTSLLDAIRKTAVTKQEAGGITQHIGAYSVQTPSGGVVTFIDTPGHEAFTAMRSRGAKVTDIVVLVVAADDGVMPQTVEAINHAKAAKVPLIVAVNKMDKEQANPDRVKNQLAEQGLIPEEWGGDTIMVPVSAHTGDGLDLLLENLIIQAEILELKGNPERNAVGTVIESEIDRGRGPVLTVLVQNGTLKKGDNFIVGSTYGRVKALYNDQGQPVETIGPGVPAEVLGADQVPLAGDDFIVLETETEARDIAAERARKLRVRDLASKIGIQSMSITLENFSEFVSDSGAKELPIIVKGDFQGSVEAVSQSLLRLTNEEVRVRLIHKGVGSVTENDVQLAAASKALIVAFNVRAEVRAQQMAEQEGIRIAYSRIIYELVEEIQGALTGMREPVFKETTLGRVEVREVIRVPRVGVIAGSYVMDGTVERGASVRLLRDNRVIFEGRMASLRRFKDDVREVAAGYECGISLDGYQDIRGGDVFEVFKMEEVKH